MEKPIRVLQVLARMNRGGAETMIMNLYRNIDRSKVQFDFLVHTEQKCDYDDEIYSLGGNIYRVPQYTVKNHLTYKKVFNQFFAEHTEYKIVHCHINSTAAIIAKCAKKNGKKIIVHSHSTSSGKGVSNAIKDYLQKPLKSAKTTSFRMACSKEAGEWLFGNLDFMILNNAIETEKFVFNECIREKVRKEYKLQNRVVVGHVGNFTVPKNHSFLIDIFTEIRKKNESAVLMLVGDGGLRQEIEEKVARLGLTDSVIFTGVQANVNELLMGMDVFLFPSLFEGLGIVLIEAQATGLKCFTSEIVVPMEAKATDLLQYITLDNGAKQWSDNVLEVCSQYERENKKLEIVNHGYDIQDNVRILQKFYIEQRNK